MIYLDSAAVVKLIRVEAGTPELLAWLNERSDLPLVASALVEVEVPRALRRCAPQALVGVPAVLSRLYRVDIDAFEAFVAPKDPTGAGRRVPPPSRAGRRAGGRAARSGRTR